MECSKPNVLRQAFWRPGCFGPPVLARLCCFCCGNRFIKPDLRLWFDWKCCGTTCTKIFWVVMWYRITRNFSLDVLLIHALVESDPRWWLSFCLKIKSSSSEGDFFMQDCKKDGLYFRLVTIKTFFKNWTIRWIYIFDVWIINSSSSKCN